MKVSIIFVVPPGNWAAEHFARKLPRNCGEYGAILRSVDYVCAGTVSLAAYYWIFVKFEYSFNKIIPAKRRERERGERKAEKEGESVTAVQLPFPCFAVKRFTRDSSVGSRLSIRFCARLRLFFAYDLLMRAPRGVLHDTSSQLTSSCFRGSGFKSDRDELGRPKTRWPNTVIRTFL